MSTKYPGGFITKSPVAPTATAASGVWTLDQQQQAQRAGTWPAPPVFIEDVFQTWLYTGNGSTQTITNGINLSGNGGMVWMKARSAGTASNIYDTARGNFRLISNSDADQLSFAPNGLTAFSANGFTIAKDNFDDNNVLNATYASWTFREQPKFFDVVTYTGNGVSGRKVAHSLGSVPGAIFVKATSDASDWCCMVRASNTTYASFLSLNTTGPAAFLGTLGDPPTSTEFTTNSLGNSAGTYTPNVNGVTYVAYLFAHNAGGFGLTGTDNVISCGSYTGNGSSSGPTVSLGYEPQFLIIKAASSAQDWWMFDNMRGMPVGSADAFLKPNTSAAEGSLELLSPNATGFQITNTFGDFNANGQTYIYIAIRRGPMKTPTTGTSVFSPILANVSNTTKLTTNFPVDLSITNETSGGGAYWMDRLRGALSPGLTGNTPYLQSSNTGADTLTPITSGWDNTGLLAGPFFGGVSAVRWNLRRAPGFFDVVCYTASTSQLTLNHNLGVVPEMIITKARNNPDNWYVWCQYNSSIAEGACISLNSSASTASAGGGSLSSFTASSFNTFLPGINGWTAVSYLFASCPGVSKVGTFTGTGATQVINCGFTGGARFVLIKATSTTGDWYVWDSARGIVAGNDPYLELNTTDAEVTNTDWVDTAASGFELSNAGGNLANSNGVSYIFLAIA